MRAAALVRPLVLTGILLATPALSAATPITNSTVTPVRAFDVPASAATPTRSPATPTASPSGGSSDVAALAKAIAPLATTGHDLVMTTRDSRLAGSVDPGARAARVAVAAGEIKLDEIVDDGRVWLKMDLGVEGNTQFGIRPGRWMRLDPRTLATDNNLPIRLSAADPIDMPGILRGVTTVTRPSANRFTGAIDLTKVTGHNRPDPDSVAKAGNLAKSAPYTLTTDMRGRVTSFAVDTLAFDPGLSIQVAYSRYGDPSAITGPAGAIRAPRSVYAIVD